MNEVRVIKPGLLTTVQDLGRWGFQAHGVSVAGAMDSFSHRLANALVGNPMDAATLEATLRRPELEFGDARVVAVTGAEFETTLDGRPVPSNASFEVARGSRLAFGRRARGTRAYVAVGGGLAVPLILGSRATHVMSAMGGLEGRALRAGDRLPLGNASAPGRSVSYSPARSEEQHVRVRVLPGLQRDEFSDEAFKTLQAAPYRVGLDSDRTGFRLEGAGILHQRDGEMISDATPMGAIQIPGSGLPILLMADRQTTGGYPQLATVITADLCVAAQLGPGDTVAFVECGPQEAMTALIAKERALLAVERSEAT